MFVFFFFFFSSRRRHTRSLRDWSSDVCSSDLLVENALQHTPPDTTVEVTVSAAPALQVTDRGPGVPASDRERLFERFWRGRRSGDGAGLGLAIVQRIVAAHGGSLTVDDAPCGGGRFTIRLPRPAPV